jgi:hypothetical protein
VISRLIAASAYAGAAFLFGVALGERGELGPVQHLFRFVIPIATIVLMFVSRQGRVQVLATGAAMLVGVWIGQQQFARAWEDCVRRAPIVRTALLEHHARNGGYPARLEELPIELPCRCGFRNTILHYLSNERGFTLWYTNDRERRIATDTRQFATRAGPESLRAMVPISRLPALMRNRDNNDKLRSYLIDDRVWETPRQHEFTRAVFSFRVCPR